MYSNPVFGFYKGSNFMFCFLKALTLVRGPKLIKSRICPCNCQIRRLTDTNSQIIPEFGANSQNCKFRARTRRGLGDRQLTIIPLSYLSLSFNLFYDVPDYVSISMK